ncbi:MAG TPA: DNA replication and repair protein RecF, partial [Patescibacteria group bacterium]
VTKSYRVTNDRDAIQWEEKYCRVILERTDDQFEYVLSQEGEAWRKVIKHNGSAIPLTQVYGLLPTILFSPETMQLIDGSPSERRRFLDTVLSQADRAYIEALVTYRRVIKERHFVLLRLQQGLGSEDELDFWDTQLVQSGSYILEKRQEFLKEINRYLETIYPQFVEEGAREKLVLQYKPTVQISEYADKLRRMRHYDSKRSTTHIGPHRDELTFLLRERDITLFASRGELRRSVLATKLAETLFLKDKNGHEPVLLLDDVFSELDADRRGHFLEAIKDYTTIITTTDESFVTNSPLPDMLIHRLPLHTKE